jgi:hypothetical protein
MSNGDEFDKANRNGPPWWTWPEPVQTGIAKNTRSELTMALADLRQSLRELAQAAEKLETINNAEADALRAELRKLKGAIR